MIVSQIPPGQGQQPRCLGTHSRHGFIEFINWKSQIDLKGIITASETILWRSLNAIHLIKQIQQVPSMSSFPFLRVNQQPCFRGVWTSIANVILTFQWSNQLFVFSISFLALISLAGTFPVAPPPILFTSFFHISEFWAAWPPFPTPPSFIALFSSLVFCHVG